jgi:hypothetical protein
MFWSQDQLAAPDARWVFTTYSFTYSENLFSDWYVISYTESGFVGVQSLFCHPLRIFSVFFCGKSPCLRMIYVIHVGIAALCVFICICWTYYLKIVCS